MHLKNQLPTAYLLRNHAKSWFRTVSRFGFFIARKHHQRAPATAWPTGSIVGPYAQPPAQSNRLMRSYIWHAWKEQLSPAERTAWETAAPHVPILNYKGKSATTNGFGLFAHFMSISSLSFHTSGLRFVPNPAAIHAAPPVYINPKPPLSIGSISAVASDHMTFTFSTDVSTGSFYATLLIGPAPSPGQQHPNRKFRTLNHCYAVQPSYNQPYTCTCNWRNIIEIPPNPGLRQLRLIVPVPGFDAPPPDWLGFTLDLSIPIP